MGCVEGAPVPAWLSAACRAEQLLHAYQHYHVAAHCLEEEEGAGLDHKSCYEC